MPVFSHASVESSSPFTYLASTLDKSPGLLFNAWHVRVRGVDKSGDLCRAPEAVLRHRPAQVQPWGRRVRLHRPVGIRGAINIVNPLMVCQLWEACGQAWCLDCGPDQFDFWLCQEADHVH